MRLVLHGADPSQAVEDWQGRRCPAQGLTPLSGSVFTGVWQAVCIPGVRERVPAPGGAASSQDYTGRGALYQPATLGELSMAAHLEDIAGGSTSSGHDHHAEGRNVADRERVASVLAGTGLLAFAATRRRGALAAATVGAGLIARGVTGHCAVYHAAHVGTRSTDTRDVLSGAGGVRVLQRVFINRPIEEVYAFWRDLRNLVRFTSHVQDVTLLDERRSHWVAQGPVHQTVEWDAEIINDVPNQVIGWRSLAQADVVSAGSVNFDRGPRGKGTVVTVKLQYEPPAGRVGAWIARLFGKDASHQIHEDLRRLKRWLEAGEIAPVNPPSIVIREPGLPS
jgi:uncharacterized membrane protein